MPALAAVVAEAEERGDPPPGTHQGEERFAGYGVMGLPFASGHLLAMRRFPSSSVGPGYTSVWHRDPRGRWAFWQDQADELACPRYFSAAIAETRRTPIELDWQGDTMRLGIPELAFDWTVTMASSPVTRALSAVGSMLPDRAWRARPVLAAMGPLAGAALRAGRVGLVGSTPNGQHFVANPMQIWLVADSAATLGDEDLGPPAPLPAQTRLGDFWIPNRGLFAIGRAFFRTT